MYATIIQSAPSSNSILQPDGTTRTVGVAIRQTAVIPFDGSVKVFTRFAGKRGIAGSWIQVAPEAVPGERLVQEPQSVAMTLNDERDVRELEKPTVLLQKLVRRVADQTELNADPTATLEAVTESVVEDAVINPALLARYLGGAITPTKVHALESIPAEHLPQPVVEPVMEVEPLPLVPTVTPDSLPSTEFWATLSTPTMESVKHYIERVHAGGKTDTQVFDSARKRQRSVVIYGPAGTGKTLSAKHYAGINSLPFTVFECNPQVDEEVVQGQYMPTGVGNELEWRYSALATALSQPGVVLLNESTRMTAKSNALFLRILQERELQVSRHKNEVIKVHPECLIITDANPGYRGTMASDQAFLDRFAYRLEYAYDIEIEKHFIPSPSLLSLVADLRKQADREDKWSTPISTRLLEAFVEHATDLGMASATDMFIKAFPLEERDALKMLFEVNSELIADELGVTA